MLASNNPVEFIQTLRNIARLTITGTEANSSAFLPSSVKITNSNSPAIFISFGTTRLWLQLTTKQVQLLKLQVQIGSTDISDNVIGQLGINWPEEGGGTLQFDLRGHNPFASGSAIKIDEQIDASVTFTDPDTGQATTVKLFRGRVVNFTYTPDTDVLSLDCQDMSRDVSHDTDKLNQEIHAVDPIITEQVTATSNTKIVVSRNIDTTSENPVFGIWDATDTSRAINIAEQIDFIVSGNTIIVFQTNKVVAGRNYTVRYTVPVEQFARQDRTKSQIIRQIAQLAGIQNVIIEREGFTEDELVKVNVVANQEFPLDIIRKVCVPQTWRVAYDEYGVLVIRRDVLKVTPDFTHDEETISENSLRISKNTDNVINEIRISGIIKRLGRQ